ncbi:hypothetical protein C0Q70_08396 [Pomacea canaliculata]|uniref:Uncharacterized protein n=1 Tax=Pomacea canaliculata TaxID=400727 RepID=A0A2T7PHQ4_POMCA|nr:hypothetical protein C0Q70_08396 [Pomacea canaliculata]
MYEACASVGGGGRQIKSCEWLNRSNGVEVVEGGENKGWSVHGVLSVNSRQTNRALLRTGQRCPPSLVAIARGHHGEASSPQFFPTIEGGARRRCPLLAVPRSMLDELEHRRPV